MRKNTKKAVCIFFAVLLLVCSFPMSVFAVDPVSASVIANAFAQAITAYGAANGVSLTFDVANTDGIGESVHELWTAFRTGTQTADDYDTLAEALFPDLYYKAEKIIAGAQTASYVGMHITSEYAEEFDNFFNWLLSGPAQMTQVDNQYYEWSQAQMGNAAVPISVLQKIQLNFNGFSVSVLPASFLQNGASQEWQIQNTNSGTYYSYIAAYGSSYKLVIFNPSVFTRPQYRYRNLPDGNFTSWSSFSTDRSDSVTNVRYISESVFSPSGNVPIIRVTSDDGLSYWEQPSHVLGITSDSTASETANGIGVKAYGDSSTADFPDTADPNYDALHRAKDIPLDQPWDDTQYGDGTGTLTETESGTIAEDLAAVIEGEGELTLAGDQTADPGGDDDDDDKPSDDPGDYGVVGLEHIFPFCIPFDIYNFLDALAATPTAPHFTATLQLPAALGGAQTIDLNFDNPTFNQLAQLLRLLELLAFIVGLALLTRSMFIRG